MPQGIDIGNPSRAGRSPMNPDQTANLFASIGTMAAGVGSLLHGGGRGGGGYMPSDPGASAMQMQAQAAQVAQDAANRNMMMLGLAGLAGLGLVGLAISQQK